MQDYNAETEEKLISHLENIREFMDTASLTRIINKLTDYAEIISEGKLLSIINFNYNLNRSESTRILDFLIDSRAVSRINIIASKGIRNLDNEFISNVFSNPHNPESLSAYISIRNILENRLTHQTQQYNMNMNKNNTTQSMPINELRGHVKTILDFSINDITLSSKAQHGYIAATLHDAYVIMIQRTDWWNDKTYIKFFFNEDSQDKKFQQITSRESHMSLAEINKRLSDIISRADESVNQTAESIPDINVSDHDFAGERFQVEPQRAKNTGVDDKMMQIPFARQYGARIDSILAEIFEKRNVPDSEKAAEIAFLIYSNYESNNGTLGYYADKAHIVDLATWLIRSDLDIKSFTEKMILPGRKDTLSRFLNEDRKKSLNSFIAELFSLYFNEMFRVLFRIIRSPEIIKFACAFTIKRIYLTRGENLGTFGYFLINSIAKAGRIKTG